MSQHGYRPDQNTAWPAHEATNDTYETTQARHGQHIHPVMQPAHGARLPPLQSQTYQHQAYSSNTPSVSPATMIPVYPQLQQPRPPSYPQHHFQYQQQQPHPLQSPPQHHLHPQPPRQQYLPQQQYIYQTQSQHNGTNPAHLLQSPTGDYHNQPTFVPSGLPDFRGHPRLPSIPVHYDGTLDTGPNSTHHHSHPQPMIHGHQTQPYHAPGNDYTHVHARDALSPAFNPVSASQPHKVSTFNPHRYAPLTDVKQSVSPTIPPPRKRKSSTKLPGTSSASLESKGTGTIDQPAIAPSQDPLQQNAVKAVVDIKPALASSTTNVQKSQSPMLLEHKSLWEIKPEHNPANKQSDHHLLLLSLGERYLSGAYQLAAQLDLQSDATALEKYRNLIAASIGCFESFLANIKTAEPALEARVRLTLARIHIDETDNDTLVEDILSKGIALCDRHRMSDQGYSMQYLLVTMTHRANSRAAQKLLDLLIRDVDAAALLHWMFAFRFLKVSLSVHQNDLRACLPALQDLSGIARSNNEPAIAMLVAALQVLIHLRMDSPDAVMLASNALATARAHQLDPAANANPALTALSTMLDLVSDTSSATLPTKIEAMQRGIDGINSNSWHKDGSLTIPIDYHCPDVGINTGGIFQTDATGKCLLPFMWIRLSELYAVAYLLSGLVGFQKNHTESSTDKFLDAGLKLAMVPEEPLRQPMQHLLAYQKRRRVSQCNLHLCAAIVACSRSRHDNAEKNIESLRETISQADGSSLAVYSQFCTYARGLVLQSRGDLEGAIVLYNRPELSMTTHGKLPAGNDGMLRVLAGLNSVLAHSGSATGKRKALEIIEQLRPSCQNHRNQAVAAAFSLLHALVVAEPMTRVKADISRAITLSRQVNNQQLLCMAMNLLDVRFMVGTVGKQSEAAGHTAASLSRQGQGVLFAAAAFAKWSRCADLHGDQLKAARAAAEADRYMARVPQTLGDCFVDS